MRIPIGEYVRTENGLIAKAISSEYEYKDNYKQDFDNEILNDWYNDEIIVKNSQNIIDLIEVGDLAIMNCYGLIIKKVITQDDIWELKTGNYQLLKILTKEKFDSESYEV